MSEEAEDYTAKKLVYFRPRQLQRLETWLRRNHPDVRPGTYIREAALRDMKRQEPEDGIIPLHLSKEDEKRIMAQARVVRHRDIAIFLEEVALRVAESTPEEFLAFWIPKPRLDSAERAELLAEADALVDVHEQRKNGGDGEGEVMRKTA